MSDVNVMDIYVNDVSDLNVYMDDVSCLEYVYGRCEYFECVNE